MLHDALHKVVYLIDTMNGKEQLLRNYNARTIYRGWTGEIGEDDVFLVSDERIVIITYTKFGCLLQRNPDFHTHFDYESCTFKSTNGTEIRGIAGQSGTL